MELEPTFRVYCQSSKDDLILQANFARETKSLAFESSPDALVVKAGLKLATKSTGNMVYVFSVPEQQLKINKQDISNNLNVLFINCSRTLQQTDPNEGIIDLSILIKSVEGVEVTPHTLTYF